MKETIGCGTLYFALAQTVQHGANNSNILGSILKGCVNLIHFFYPIG